MAGVPIMVVCRPGRKHQRVVRASPRRSASDGPHGVAIGAPADRNVGEWKPPWPTPTWLDHLMTYLDTLNPEQRRAVEHGVVAPGANIAGPLLVIAGAGSGKTSTLAHRVAHLIVNGGDPGRILLLTFS